MGILCIIISNLCKEISVWVVLNKDGMNFEILSLGKFCYVVNLENNYNKLVWYGLYIVM